MGGDGNEAKINNNADKLQKRDGDGVPIKLAARFKQANDQAERHDAEQGGQGFARDLDDGVFYDASLHIRTMVAGFANLSYTRTYEL